MAKSESVESALIVLHGRASSVVLELDGNGAPLWRYWGARLIPYPVCPEPVEGLHPASKNGTAKVSPSISSGRTGWGLDDHIALNIPPLRTTRPEPSFALNEDVPFSIFPTFGIGWFGPSALLAHRSGEDFAQCWTVCAVEWLTPAEKVRIRLSDDVAHIAVEVTLALDPTSDILAIQTTLANTSDNMLDIQHLAAACLPLPQEALRLQHSIGRHNNEFQHQEEALGRGGWRRENRRGITGHGGPCGAVVLREDGGAWGAQLAWSGNSAQSIDWVDDGQYAWQLGEWLAPGEVRLAAGESLAAPVVLATYSPEGADGVARNFHTDIRARMNWPDGKMKPRPVHLNTWEGFYFDHDEAALMELADAAAEIGIERFVLDDGWFHGRNDDTRGLGDWWPDVTKYPNGLAPLAAHVTGLGMEFGLWMEPEMVSPESDLFRAHPDWALQIAGRPLLTARNQLVLDLTRTEVSDYLFGCLDKLLRDFPITYLKWDHNRDLTTAGNGQGRAAYHAQVLAVYALLDRIRAAHPRVEIESCAGGGGRIDAGIIQRTHRFWASDCIDAVSRLPIQRGFLQFMPPELMGSHVGASPAHSTGRSQALDFRAAVALTGHFGVELDVRALAAAERARLAHWIALYKQFRNQLHHGQVYRGDAGDGVFWQAHGAADEWLLFVYRVSPTCQRYAPTARLPFIESNLHYTISQLEPVVESVQDIHGAWLREMGLHLPPMQAESALIYRLRAY
jgi:alpha-galactosidase